MENAAVKPPPTKAAADVSNWTDAALRARKLSRPDLAAQAMARAVGLSNRDPNLWLQLGHDLDAARDPAGAEQAYRQVAALVPSRPDLRLNVGAMLQKQNRFADAAEEYRGAAAASENQLSALNNLAGVQAAQGRADAAAKTYDRAAKTCDAASPMLSNRLYNLHYLDSLCDAEIASEHLGWGRRFAERLSPMTEPAGRDRDKRRLRIAYMSPNLNRHSVAYFAEPLLRGHDRRRTDVLCYSLSPVVDPMTERLKTVADAWVDASRLDDASLAARIVADGVDVLIDLAGHTANGRPGVLARRPASLQATYLGYPNTTGLDAVDLRFTDGLADPASTGGAGSEHMIRLPRPFLAYAPPQDAPSVRPQNLSRGRDVVFGSFNNLAKLSPSCLALWAETLHAVPGSRLVLKARAFADAGNRSDIEDRFARHGVGRERLDLRPHTGALKDHLAAYGEVDIALDAAPYNGATTTMEALWMGAPVVSLAGDRHAGRVGHSLLGALGLGDLVQADGAGFVAAAARLADDVELRNRLRHGLRDAVAASPLSDGAGLAQAIEAAIFRAWRAA